MESRNRCVRGSLGEGRIVYSYSSGIPFGEEVQNTVYVGGVADISHLHINIDKSVDFVHFDRERRTIREVVNQGVYLAQVNGVGKDAFHKGSLSKMKNVNVHIVAGMRRKRHTICSNPNGIFHQLAEVMSKEEVTSGKFV